MKKLIRVTTLILILTLLATPIVAMASDVTASKYYALIQVSNNGTATTNVATTCNISTQALIDGGYLSASANNCAIQSSAGADLPFMPGVSGNPWGIWVPSIGANSYLTDILYTANSTGGELRYFPATGGMTTLDSDSLELGDNYTIIQSGWVNTNNGTDKNLVYKPGAFRTYISGTGNITSDLPEDFLTYTEVDGSDRLTVTSSTATGIDVDQDIDVYLYKDKGANYFDALDIDFEIYISSASLDDGHGGMAITNRVGTQSAFAVTDISVISARVAGPTYRIILRRGNAADADFYDGAADTPYYCTLLRASANDTVRVEIYLEPERETPLDTLTLGGFGAATKWQYVYGFVNNNIPQAGKDWDGYVKDLYWAGGGTAVTATGVTSDEHKVKVKGNYALDFDGIDDLVSANTTIADIQDDLTGSIEIWFKSDNLTGLHGLFCASDSGDPTSWVYIFTNGTNLDVGVYEAGVRRFSKSLVGVTLVLDTWYHLIIAQDGVLAVGYVDGVKYDFAGGHINYGAWFSDVNNIDDVAFGARMEGGVRKDYFKGLIAEARIYDRALSEDEAGERYNDIYSNETGLTSRWYMDDGSGTRVYDSSGNGYDATQYTTGWVSGMLRIYVDDVLKDITTSSTVPPNANDWAALQNDVMPYMEYHEVSVNSTQVQYIEWEYATTFSDSSGFDNDATPTFRSASSDVDVTAELISFLPISEAKAPAYVLAEAPAFIEEVPTVVSEWSVTPPAGEFPLAGVITAVANATDTPAQLPLVLIAGFVIIGLSLAISGMMRKYGSGTVLVKVIVIASMMGVFVALGNFGIDFWMIFVFLIIGIALSMASRQLGWQ